MSRYRKIEVRTWSDERFRCLSSMPPSGQGLWFFLLTGPHTGPIPGLFRAGRAAMAEELGWELEAFDEAFQEVSQNGMAKADFKARLVWLPNALKHNKPESPNVVRSWRVELDLLPECDLKRQAIAFIRETLKTIGPAYVSAFDEAFSGDSKKPSAKASLKASVKAMANQEQEQEQEQKKAAAREEHPPSPPEPPPEPETPPAAAADPIHARAVEITVMLRKRGAALQASDPRIRGWAEKGVTDAQLLTALETAEERRRQKADPRPINSGLVDSILPDVSSPSAHPKTVPKRPTPENFTQRDYGNGGRL